MAGTDDPAADSKRAGALDPAVVQAAIAVAARAPSIFNTQPWRWRLDGDSLALLADRTRQLGVADPDGHSMYLSCGAAWYLTEVALRAQGLQIETQLLPSQAEPDVLVRFRSAQRRQPDDDDLALADAAVRRRSDRRPFGPDKVSDAEMESLEITASDSSAWIHFPVSEDQRINLAVAVSWADRVERDDDAYQAEMNRWLRDPDVNVRPDGVSVDQFPHVPEGEQRHSDVPQRDFEVGVTGRQFIERDFDEKPLIGVVLTEFDNPADHLRAGRAMMKLMLRAEQLGLSTCALSQAVDFAAFRTRVQGLLNWVGFPQMMLRIGHPSAPLSELVRTPRRPTSEVLDVIAV